MNARRKMSAPHDMPTPTGGRPKVSTRALAQVIERSSRIQGPAAQAYVARLRRAHPAASPAEIVAKLEKRFVSVVTAGGVAVGGTATLPGIGTLAALSAAAGETVVFLEATALYVLALASVCGIPLDHRERRRALVLAVLVGDNSRTAVAELIGPGRTSGAWVSESVASLPLPAVSRLNSRMLKYFVKRFTVKRDPRAIPLAGLALAELTHSCRSGSRRTSATGRPTGAGATGSTPAPPIKTIGSSVGCWSVRSRTSLCSVSNCSTRRLARLIHPTDVR